MGKTRIKERRKGERERERRGGKEAGVEKEGKSKNICGMGK